MLFRSRGKAAGLAVIMAALFAACGTVITLGDATLRERLAAFAITALFAWGLVLAVARVIDRRPAIIIDTWGVKDRRMRVAAPWGEIAGLKIWVQESGIARASWIALEVRKADAVRSIAPIWAAIRRATLERWGRPPVALNLLGLKVTSSEVLAAIAHFRPDLHLR